MEKDIFRFVLLIVLIMVSWIIILVAVWYESVKILLELEHLLTPTQGWMASQVSPWLD